VAINSMGIVAAFNDLFRLIRDADLCDELELDSPIGLRLTYRQPGNNVRRGCHPANSRVFD
jgi:hypothetical protein